MERPTPTLDYRRKNKKRGGTSLWQDAFRRFIKNKYAILGLVILTFMILFAFIGPYFSPHQDVPDVTKANQPPSKEHWLGTDNLGRDVLLRLMLAGRISLTVGIAATLILLLIGVSLGAISGYYGGWVDVIIMRIADIIYAMPGLPILIVMGAIMSDLKIPPAHRIYYVMFILGIISWVGVARLVRSQILSLKEQEFMLATEVLGLRDSKKIIKHLFPNVLPTVIVAGTLGVASSIISESALSFLGLGVVPPTPSWGYMLSAANNMIDFAKRPWLWIPPGVAIMLTVLAINFVGDALRDAFDPRQKI
ncbi:oligopeptide ABC transporter permease [Caldanaerobacter subterraneus]|uniref:Peptide/nickel transport system permease protein n=1 Tax=Caldanaerobacter subterraneus TaxID=911092 RepID=A0A4R2K399_9THEO|nr:oligopeptide ABC transporter permease [Caldanaerobacter subterraneus]TCO66237.1 peptide/nickel transport system permease protein [Caldanaerobacter subterraneus]